MAIPVTRETRKEVTVNGVIYLLSRMTAETASRIFNMMMAAFVRANKDDNSSVPAEPPEELSPEARQTRAEGTVSLMWTLLADALDDTAYARVQKQCLACCAMLDGERTLPVKMADGRWVVKELETDAPAVNQLITEVLVFNISPFFTAGPSSAAAKVPA